VLGREGVVGAKGRVVVAREKFVVAAFEAEGEIGIAAAGREAPATAVAGKAAGVGGADAGETEAEGSVACRGGREVGGDIEDGGGAVDRSRR